MIEVSTLYDAQHKEENDHLVTEKLDYGYPNWVPTYNFIAFHPKLNNGKVEWNPKINEDFATILPAKELRVFSDTDNLPDDALKRNEAIMKYLRLH